MTNNFFKTLLAISIMCIIFSCSQEKNYYDAIPSECMALVRVNASNDSSTDNPNAKALELFLQSNISVEDGIDLESPVFLFETNDGTLGVCGKISSASKFEDFLNRNSATSLKDRKDSKFALINHSFLVGYNDEVLLVTGPIVASSESQLASRLSRYLEMNPERGIGNSDVFSQLSSRQSDITMFTRLSALPKQFNAPFLLGTPTGTSPQDVIMNADIEIHDSILTLKGSLTSENLLIKQSLERTINVFRPFEAKDADYEGSAITLCANVNGLEFINLLQANKDLNSILNNKSIKDKLQSIDGNMMLRITPSGTNAENVKYNADVVALDKSSVNGKTHYKLIINLDDSIKESLNQLLPFFGSIKRIEYIY